MVAARIDRVHYFNLIHSIESAHHFIAQLKAALRVKARILPCMAVKRSSSKTDGLALDAFLFFSTYRTILVTLRI